MSKALLVLGSIVVLGGLPVAGWFVGLEAGESMCAHEEFLDCIAEPILGGVIGFGVGVLVSILLCVLLVRRRRRRTKRAGSGDAPAAAGRAAS